jgi:hypothetical protein
VGLLLTSAAQLRKGIRSFIHENPAVTFHFHQPGNRTPTSESAQARFYDIKMLDLRSIRPEILLAPPSEYHKEDKAVYEDEEGGIIGNAGHEGLQGCSFRSKCGQWAPHWEG